MKIVTSTKKVVVRKPKTGIKAVVPKARVIDSANPSVLCVKKVMSDSIVSSFRSVGWTVEGHIRYSKGGQCVGLAKGTEHVSVEDSGAYPWFLGDTVIRVGEPMTRYHDAPIELR